MSKNLPQDLKPAGGRRFYRAPGMNPLPHVLDIGAPGDIRGGAEDHSLYAGMIPSAGTNPPAPSIRLGSTPLIRGDSLAGWLVEKDGRLTQAVRLVGRAF